MGKKKKIGLAAGPALMLLMLILPTPEGMSPAAQRTAAAVLLMVVWWVTEAIPIPATSLVPLAAFPLLGILDVESTAANYAEPNIFLFLGGFMIALAMEKWGLHRRIALQTVRLTGSSLRTLVLGFMIASALLSMWISNTATAMMMLPIAMAVLAKFDGQEYSGSLGLALMLGIAYACSVGGMGTLIGTPPNIALAGSVAKLVSAEAEIGFGQWMLVGLPMVVLFVPLIWLYLVRIAAPVPKRCGGPDLKDEMRSLGPMSRGEIIVLVIFVLAALGWILREPVLARFVPGITDAVVAMTAALLLFVVPVHPSEGRFVMDWEQGKKLPWGILLLFGGGFAIATAMDVTGLSAWLSSKLTVFSGLPSVLVILVVCTFIAMLTELTSNTATTLTMLPVLASTARAMGVHPFTLMVPATLAASCAFMLPVATPPNAIVFASGKVPMGSMFRVGFWMNVIGILLTTLLMSTLGKVVFAVGPVLPEIP